ncbi:uncharacterized protein N7511_006090 [Penicillium nucicola]|uniref:uncharacterized protein n=1 Tax=Penicillium nucicola TaxID=1850975 RepID=UPI002544D910|nr:uncharacterized protein N7511_006090 [Penicillium nucicola]KAJ5757396.1 hypothetical protein N7511_006090 [Penicillium nucicola]
MQDSRRRQLHSCDQCRKGKRGCDAPKMRRENGFSCSNCKRWKKDCTFNWLAVKHTAHAGGQKKKIATAAKSNCNSDPSSVPNSLNFLLDEALQPSQLHTSHPTHSADISSFASSSPSSIIPEEPIIEGSDSSNGLDSHSGGFPWILDSPDDWNASAITQGSEKALGDIGFQHNWHTSLPISFGNKFELGHQIEDESNTSPSESTESTLQQRTYHHPTGSTSYDPMKLGNQKLFCISSNNAARDFARATMTRNLIRIYHDSMENALSCWLTEHNCPYSDSTGVLLPERGKKDWGPSWSNRMCIRVCRLDRASSSIRGRSLSAEEDGIAFKTLHLAIMAFASQWTQHARKGTSLSVPAEIDCDERAIRVNVWNKAKKALEQSTGIPSFRIIFANIIFSLTQSPLDKTHDSRLDRLLENDPAPVFLENANRQLFTLRHKFTRRQREAAFLTRDSRRGSLGSTMTDIFEAAAPSTPRNDPILTSHEYRSTLGLMFWLGVMFDTLSAAMYQRPLVVSDEDSQIASASPTIIEPRFEVDLDGWTISANTSLQSKDVWGDFFLHPPADAPESNTTQPRWPCSYEEAASVLSEATPVKVLLYRRVTQLQTLVYRGASSECLESLIKRTMLVYEHWNSTYQSFMLDCVASHEQLPPRIQSWYIILDGHWHLATMLLADVIENIDNGRLSSITGRRTREATNIVSNLRKENAMAVGALARSSLQGQAPSINGHFHDSLNEVAFLVEPWTVVLIHSFAKAGYISLDYLDVSDEHGELVDNFRNNCEQCISALQYLGRKSDMASLVAENLSMSLDLKLSLRI